MIYSLLANGASVIPLFIPGIPQVLLLFHMAFSLYSIPRKINFIILMFPMVLAVLAFLAIFTGNETRAQFLVKLIINAIVATGIAIVLERKYGNKFGFVYTRALTFLTVLGILGLLLSLISNWSISTNIGERSYHTNILTSWITDNGFNSSSTIFSPFPYRLQSIFDEPGTYGILTIPALFYSLEKRFDTWAAVLLCGVFLSESLNAWALCIPILFRAFYKLKSPWLKLLLLLCAVGGVVKILPVLMTLYEIKFGLAAAYSNVSSFGVRQSEYNFVLEHGLDYVLPFQAENINSVFPQGISVSYVRWYLNFGVFSLFIIIPVVLNVIFDLFRKEMRRLESSFALVLAATILLSGFQRSSFLDHIIFLTLIFWYLCYKMKLRRTLKKHVTDQF